MKKRDQPILGSDSDDSTQVFRCRDETERVEQPEICTDPNGGFFHIILPWSKSTKHTNKNKCNLLFEVGGFSPTHLKNNY